MQKHAASRLHYDLRLELQGVLKSWAIPKGPSLDPAEKRLAMQTEDHPVEYGDFEGVIPEGEYGGGTVLVWDRGEWEPVGDPHQGLHRGSLEFRLSGRKLEGGFALVRVRSRNARERAQSWLLVKKKDAGARPGDSVTDREPLSVLTGRDLEAVARDRDRVWHSHGQTAAVTRVSEGTGNVDSEGSESAAVEDADGHEAVERAVVRAKVAAKTVRRGRPITAARLREVGRRSAMPDWIEPQLATLTSRAPAGDEWLHEMKIDGYRIQARIDGHAVTLLSRRGHDWTARLPQIAEALRTLPLRQAFVDGEAAVLLPGGKTSFQALQGWMGAGPRTGDLVYYAFDLLYLDGHSLAAAPLELRKELLGHVLAAAGDRATDVRLSEHVVGSGAEFHAQACRLGLEGIVSKRRDAAHAPGRGQGWLKIKCVREQEFVVGGFTAGVRAGIGALLVGVYEGDRLRYAGKVGTGFTHETALALEQRLGRLAQARSPFADRVPEGATVRWVRPERVVSVAFTEWTAEGRLRHPSYRGLREDKAPREVVRETAPEVAPGGTETAGRPAAAPAAAGSKRPRRSGAPALARGRARAGEAAVEIAGVRLTNPGRVVYPELGLTKRALAEFYVRIADWILPQLAGRPTTLVRCPEGVQDDCFYQKHVGFWAPEVLRRVRIQEARKAGEYLVVDDLPGLVGLVQLGILEIHTWNSLADHLEQPDRVVFDLDPDPELPWERVTAAARRVRERLLELDLESYVKTTGGKGLHVVVPLQRGATWEESGRFAEAIALEIAREEPAAYLAEMSKARRRGRIFIDHLRNRRGATSVSAYSTRARPQAPVSTPLRWAELSDTPGSAAFTVETLPARLASSADAWAGFDRVRQRLTASLLKTVGVV